MGGSSKSTVEDDIIVTVCEGKLRGKIMYNRRGRKFFAFLAIPYAIPPIGNLRFKASIIDFVYNFNCFHVLIGTETYTTLERHKRRHCGATTLLSVGTNYLRNYGIRRLFISQYLHPTGKHV